LTIGVGRHESWFEAWGTADETLEMLRKTIDAAVAGNYEEFFKGSKHVSRLSFSGDPFVFKGNTFAWFPPRFGGWTRATYEPY